MALLSSLGFYPINNLVATFGVVVMLVIRYGICHCRY